MEARIRVKKPTPSASSRKQAGETVQPEKGIFSNDLAPGEKKTLKNDYRGQRTREFPKRADLGLLTGLSGALPPLPGQRDPTAQPGRS